VTPGPEPLAADDGQAGRAGQAGSRTLVLGGARSGKSAYAESLLRPFDRVRYIATGYPPADDRDWSERVRRHRERRPATWRTIETTELRSVLDDAGSPILIDCFSVWLTRLMDAHDCWQTRRVPPALADEISDAVQAWQACQATAVAVSGEVGMGVLPGTWTGRVFGDLLGGLNQRLAAASDHVWLVVAGLPVRVK
jgi:adenosylcobinamide kinase/adenosylcobinamide-phosphate guanylyltransferase